MISLHDNNGYRSEFLKHEDLQEMILNKMFLKKNTEKKETHAIIRGLVAKTPIEKIKKELQGLIWFFCLTIDEQCQKIYTNG